MRRVVWLTAALLLAGAVRAQAQECRRYAGGSVTICERHRTRERHEREHRREWGREPAELGVRGGYDFRDHQGSFGAQVRVPIIREFAVAPSFDAFFGERGAEWQLNADGLIRPRELGGLYLGGGAAFIRRTFDAAEGAQTKAGWNAVAGIDGGRISYTLLRPFVEGRWTGTGDFSAFRWSRA